MINEQPIISITVNSIYDNDKLVNYEVLEHHFDNDQRITSFFIDKPDMKQYIKDLIRSL